MMQLGADGVFVGSGIFKSSDPASRGHAIVKAVTNYNNPAILAEISRGLGEPMIGIAVNAMPEGDRLAQRGW
jgi:pyridoxal 5'-phosphate synthase pdxS subunit